MDGSDIKPKFKSDDRAPKFDEGVDLAPVFLQGGVEKWAVRLMNRLLIPMLTIKSY